MIEKKRPSWLTVVEGGKTKRKEEAPKTKPESETPKPADRGVEDISTEQLISGEKAALSVMKTWKQGETAADKKSTEQLKSESALISIYISLSRNPPANFGVSVRAERVQDAAKNLRSWSVDELHTYLSGDKVWTKPSFTKAVFNEVQARLTLGDMSPRE